MENPGSCIWSEIESKEISELSQMEMSMIHLNTSYSTKIAGDSLLRSTLSVLVQNINHASQFRRSKNIMPLQSCMCILDQLGICYNIKGKPEPRFQNGIKRGLYYFAHLDEDDPNINVLYALRNGLLHNVSLVSVDKHRDNHYFFRYARNDDHIVVSAEEKWDGCFETLDPSTDRFTTLISPNKIRELVIQAVEYASELNKESKLELRLEGGARELFYTYILSTYRTSRVALSVDDFTPT